MRIPVILISILGILGLAGCSRSPQSSAEGDKPATAATGYTVRSHVLDTSSKKPIEGADVVVRKDDGTTANGKTDAKGEYVANVPYGGRPHLVLEVKKAGYIPYVQQIFQSRGEIPVEVYLKAGQWPVKLEKPADSVH